MTKPGGRERSRRRRRAPQRGALRGAKGYPVGGGGKNVDTSGGPWVEAEKALERGQGERSWNLPFREELPLLSGAATPPPRAPRCCGRAPPSLGVDLQDPLQMQPLPPQ